MHDLSTRASLISRQGCAITLAASLAVFLANSYPSPAATAEADEPASTSSIDRGPASDIRIEFVKSGREGLELSARLTEEGGLIELPVLWTVSGRAGETIYQGEQPVADLSADPGEYEVTARYGTVTVSNTVTLLERQRLGISFVLNVGGLRVLPKVGHLRLPSARAETRVFAISGKANGQMVAVSTIPGEIVRLGAGSYRIESRFTPGNAIEITNIEVKPGRLSALEMQLPAGIVRLAAPENAREVTWIIEPASGRALPPIQSSSADIVLTPGNYTARARIDGAEKTAAFTIGSGESKDILLQP